MPRETDVPGDLMERSLHLKAVRADAREADFVCSTESVDSYDEVVEQTWDLSRYERNPVVLWAHNSRELPIGYAKDVKLINGELCATLCFASEKANPMAEKVWQGIQEKTIRAVSVGFDPDEVRCEKRDGQDIYVLAKNKLFEISVVPIGANEDALKKMRSKAVRSTDPTSAHGGKDPAMNEDEKRAHAEKIAALDEKVAVATKMLGVAEASVTEAKAVADAATKAAGEQSARAEKLDAELAALKAALPAGDEKPVEKIAALVAKVAASQKAAAEAADKALDLEVEGLSGKKFAPAMKAIMLRLAKTDRAGFDEMISLSPDLGILPAAPGATKTTADAPGTAAPSEPEDVVARARAHQKAALGTNIDNARHVMSGEGV